MTSLNRLTSTSAPDFSLKTIDSRFYSLSNKKKKGKLLREASPLTLIKREVVAELRDLANRSINHKLCSICLNREFPDWIFSNEANTLLLKAFNTKHPKNDVIIKGGFYGMAGFTGRWV